MLQQTVAAERAIQLKEILDRIELPSFDSIPDRNAAAGLPSKRWRLPETEIDIALIENGPRSGEYLVSAGTVDRLPEFYERVKKLPYKPGPAAELSDVYRKLSSGGTATIYEAYMSSPVGLERIVPVRWMLRLPAWAKSPIAGVASWQWLGFLVGLAVCLGFVYGIYRLSRHLAGRRAEESGPGWHAPPDAAGDHSRDGLPGASCSARSSGLAGPRASSSPLYRRAHCISAPPGSSVIAASLVAEAIVDVRASAATEPRQPADQAGDALRRDRHRHRTVDPRRLGAGLSGLFGAGRARRRRSGRSARRAGQPRQPPRLDADHDREAVSHRPLRQGVRQRGHSRGCRLSQHADPHLGQLADIDPQQRRRQCDGREPQPSRNAPPAPLHPGHL